LKKIAEKKNGAELKVFLTHVYLSCATCFSWSVSVCGSDYKSWRLMMSCGFYLFLQLLMMTTYCHGVMFLWK
jgi:hypothetical protein